MAFLRPSWHNSSRRDLIPEASSTRTTPCASPSIGKQQGVKIMHGGESIQDLFPNLHTNRGVH